MVKTAELSCCCARCLRTSCQQKQDSANVQIDIVELHKEAQQHIKHPRKETQLGQSQSIAD